MQAEYVQEWFVVADRDIAVAVFGNDAPATLRNNMLSLPAGGRKIFESILAQQ